MVENCHLWKKKEVAKEDLNPMEEVFEQLTVYVKESHLWRYLLKCRACGQLYFYEFYEWIDWIAGNDPQYVTYIPVETAAEADKLSKLQPFELMQFSPRIQKDWPADAAEPVVQWVGRKLDERKRMDMDKLYMDMDESSMDRSIKSIKSVKLTKAELTTRKTGKSQINLTQKAKKLVKEHIKGTRKGLPDELNFQHSFRVRDIVSSYSSSSDRDEDLLLAALLHDIVEDGGISFDELIKMEFSERTIELVQLCTHPMDVKDSTQRWILMLAQLVKANDPDAWLIKLADLTDNLTQSKGLSPENRRFMIETKAPALLRLTQSSNELARMGLKNEMEKQRIDMAIRTRKEPR